MNRNKKVVVIGGGIAGIEAASLLSKIHIETHLIEQNSQLGGNVAKWFKLFPNHRKAQEVIETLQKNIPDSLNIHLNKTVNSINRNKEEFLITLSDNSTLQANAILIATGYDVFDAHLKEEYGYGIYDNVITSAELEAIFKDDKPILTKQGKEPSRIAFIHCVGSRDRKINNIYCSKVCCITAVKQAIEVRQRLPFCEPYCFYMDLRMYGLNFEEIYNESQEKYGITFIRGRLSEASETITGQIILKVEDTLLGRPMRMTVDMMVLMVGMQPSAGTQAIINLLNLNTNSSRFIACADEHLATNITSEPGIFVAGTATSPKSIDDTLADARSAAIKIIEYLHKSPIGV